MTVAAGAQNRTDAEQDPRLISVFRANEVWNGVTTTADGRVFVAFPHLDGSAGMRVAKLSHDGTAQPYPDAAWNSWQGVSRVNFPVSIYKLQIGAQPEY